MITQLFSKIISYIFPPYCYGCKTPNATICDLCLLKTKKALSSPHPFIISVYSFQSPLIRKVVHAIKYFNRKDLIAPLAEKIANEITANNLRGTLVPIPMHRLRKLMRGYNQAEELAKTISLLTSLPYDPKTLLRKGLSRRQVKAANRNQRLTNQKNTFKVNKNTTGQDFILIDDVTTTGATLRTARKALIDSGARNVWAVTIAH